MTIDIHEPELEALILDRMKRGTFQSVEEALIQALKSAPLPDQTSPEHAPSCPSPTGADLIAAMQSSPYKEIDLQPSSYRLAISEISI